jgi:hypothetical protein
VETRSSDAAERALATIVRAGDLAAAERVMFAATTDHVFIDEGHTLDFTNKAFEGVALVGPERAGVVTSMVRQTCAADRSEEGGEWNHPTTSPAWWPGGGGAAGRAGCGAVTAAASTRESWGGRSSTTTPSWS